jgi:hypothetical protein
VGLEQGALILVSRIEELLKEKLAVTVKLTTRHSLSATGGTNFAYIVYYIII